MKIRDLRKQVYHTVLVLSVALLVGGLFIPALWWGLVLLGPLALLGTRDVLQTKRSLLRTYPIVGHLRFLLEDTGPELRQYIVASNTEGRPFNRDQRSLIYQRSKDVSDKKPFGTELDLYVENYAWIAHSIAPVAVDEDAARTFRVQVGGPHCTQPYSASVFNISGMSFGSLSGAAVRAMNEGAAMGGFAQVTGEGGVSVHHLQGGGDLIWQIGTGYFGCRAPDGTFDPAQFEAQAAAPSVKMIELKISQGAKPGHGGILPGAKVTAEIALARGVPIGTTCASPSYHTAFGTPVGLIEFVQRLRELSGGKPVGFKLCVGRPGEIYAICKAMVATGITPDFITVDGGEGGTGAAPIEFSDHVGMPLREGLVIVHNALRGVGLRDRIKIAASGKLVTAFNIGAALALGADWCNSARGFMFAVGCVQAQACHTNECPVGVATQDPELERALVVRQKNVRVLNFHRHTVDALAEVVAAAGLHHPDGLEPFHLYQRTSPWEVKRLDELYTFLNDGDLLHGPAGTQSLHWSLARADSFAPAVPGVV